MSRPRATRATRKRCQDLSFRSELVPEHDQLQPSLDCGWSFDVYGGTSFLDHPERETDTYCQSDDTSIRFSLTNASLVRLVNESALDEDITRPEGPVLAQTATTQILFHSHQDFSSSFPPVSSPCKSFFPYLSGLSLPAHYFVHFNSFIAAYHSIRDPYASSRTLLLLSTRSDQGHCSFNFSSRPLPPTKLFLHQRRQQHHPPLLHRHGRSSQARLSEHHRGPRRGICCIGAVR